MQARIDLTAKTLQQKFMLHPSVQYTLSSLKKEYKKNGLYFIKTVIADLNEDNLTIFLEMLEDASVKSLIFTTNEWPPLVTTLARNLKKEGYQKTMEVIGTMLDEEVKKFIGKDHHSYSWLVRFDQAKEWGREETKKIARFLSSPAAAVIDKHKSSFYNIHSFQQLKNFAEALSHPDVKKFAELRWLHEREMKCNPETLNRFLAFLRKNEATLHCLIIAKKIHTRDMIAFSRNLLNDNVLNLISSHPILIGYVLANTWLSYCDEEKLMQHLIELREMSKITLDFILQYNNNLRVNEEGIKHDSNWQAWIMAASSLSFRKTIEKDPAFAPYIIALIKKSDNDKFKMIRYLKKLLFFRLNTSVKIQNAIDTWLTSSWCDTEISHFQFDLEKIVRVTELISDYRIRYMLEKGLIEFNRLTNLTENMTPKRFVNQCVYEALCEIDTELRDSKWLFYGPFVYVRPKGIKQLMNLFQGNSNKVLLNAVTALEEIKKPRGDNRRNLETQTFYDKTYETLMKWHPETMKTQKPLTSDEIEIRKVARVFGQVKRQRDLFFTPKDIEETPITLLSNELLAEIILSQHDQVNRAEAMDLIDDSFSKPSVRN